MEIFPFSFFTCFFASGFLVLLSFVLVLNVFGLPANWIILGLVALWKMLHPAANSFDTVFWILMACLVFLGEVLEWGMQAIKAKNYGASSSGTFVAMLGAFAGAIFFAPLFFGLGALLGALTGAWIGCFCVEMLKGRGLAIAAHAAFGAMIGRFLGTVCKCGIGGCMIALVSQKIFPVDNNGAIPSVAGEQVYMLLRSLHFYVA